MKKNSILALALSLGLVLTSCSQDTAKKEETSKDTSTSQVESTEVASENQEESAKLTFKAGTYTGKATGYNGPLELDVTFDDSKLTDIEVKSSVETDKVGNIAFPIIFEDMVAANGTGVDNVSGATVTTAAIKQAVKDAANQAEVSDAKAFAKNTVVHEAKDPIEEEYDVVVVGGGGAGMMAATESAMAGNKVIIVEKNAEIGGNTLVSGGQFQSAMPYLVWDIENPDATSGEYNGKTYDKVKSDFGRIHTLTTILNWNEEKFDESLENKEDFVAGDIEALSKRGVHEEYLPLLQELKAEIKAYLDWAQVQLDSGKAENELTLFSTTNLHKFQTYYGGIRPNADGSKWVYGSYELVSQMVDEGQEIKPWLEEMGSKFVDDVQATLIGGLWQRQNQFIGAEIDGQLQEGRWATYFEAPKQKFLSLNEENKIMTRTSADSLIEEDGRVVGVKATMYDKTEVTLKAKKGVILATGGYAANIDMVKETNSYWDKEFLEGTLGTTNRNSLQGDGIKMAEKVGATTTGEGWTQMMPLGWVQGGNLAFGGGEDVIYLNPETGKRYIDESAERDVLSLGGFENGMEHNGVKGVFIEVGNKETGIPGPYPYKDEDVEMRQYVRDLDGAAELFKELGVNISKEQLEESIKEYDMYVMGESDSLEIPKESYRSIIGNAEKDENGKYKPDTYKIGEIRIRFMAPSTHHTMGGLLVDTGRRVLDKEEKPIEGLYAAGEVTGNIHGGNRLGGNAILEIIASGRVAAEAVEEDNK